MAHITRESVKDELKKYIAEYEAKIELWHKVEIVTKKDGGKFQVYTKNFINAKVEVDLMDWLEIKVFGRDSFGHWIEDKIRVNPGIDDYRRIFAKEPEKENIRGNGWGGQNVLLEPKEVLIMIENVIDRYTKRTTEYKEELKKVDKAFDYYEKESKKFFDRIAEITGGSNSHTYYKLREKISNYPY